MRLFMALDVNKQTRAALYALQNKMKALGIAGNYVPMGNFHVTVRFLGESDRLGEIGMAMAEAVRGIRPFSLSLDRCDAFSNTAVVRLGGETKEMKALYESVGAALAEVGFPSDKRPLLPHITLCRRAEPLKGLLEQLDQAMDRTLFFVDHMTLYESVRERAGMVYRPLQKVKI